MVASQEVLYVSDLRLRQIPKYEVNNGCYLFKKVHLGDYPLCIGIIGNIREGKSGSAAVISLIEEMLDGRPLWSNLDVHACYSISDLTASQYGLEKGGMVEFESIPLEKRKFLRFDPMFHDGGVLIDEINIEYAEAYRSTSNVNLWFNEVDQQRAKLRLNIYYTVIHEMMVDSRLRNLTDLFIKCEDPALSPEGLRGKIRRGLQTKWTIYPMSRYLTGMSYYQTHQTLPPKYMQLKQFWGLWDTYRRQSKEGNKYSFKMDEDEQVEAKMTIERSPEVQQQLDEWGWLSEGLVDIFSQLQEEGEGSINEPELFMRLGVPEDMRVEVRKKLVYEHLLNKRRRSSGMYYYDVPKFSLTAGMKPMRERVPVAVG